MNKKFKKSKLIVLGLFFSLGMVACGDKTEDLKNKSSIQNQDAITRQNENDERRAAMLQQSINKLRNFIDAVEGEYTGSYRPGDTLFRSRITITSTFPRYDSDHVKSLAELEYELQNLNLNIKTVSWTDDDLYSGGCLYSDIRPDIESGYVRAFSEECSNDFFMYVSNGSAGSAEAKNEAKVLARMIKNNSLKEVKSLFITKSSIHNPKINKFFLYKD